ncbi:Alpha/beta hydrolase fold protein OS=Tsukamurella paurometabola (strain ATCC 8368 / DSM / CCUG 35730 / CIP 100753 / JCM 10117 / KCTC 9821 / NBRC 16120 /NCIMB 702349 / NCTC 13040) OX=521096 GN=Tpau_1694 PE=4 SV=1 [Tsukamurella paurometabola]|uniref:Alpha/beta hydrolase fold protein n=1 Tax=Tsukamurella paurometabola (strain ATCC 8368 / DSM 20162 / CCUG 35730 / CIP 100753 / JCM 10117 / KCTC 9821 / NBRC 16120 / NCIMB 702349 / NCTC 13040) TaxID=521096 RepID=D5UM32_TSUPD|nr:alpha/beta hydrolase [Tsukamurella paurometabola]ADG78312.1 alpha/beta hydrolase fold protein [Tsukamurella paurometabola DSM 20162]SUP31164.1 Haloacetate dehalogenase H-1 [Tsukamurella paurometabola]
MPIDTPSTVQVPVGSWTFDVSVGGPEHGVPVLLLHGFPQTEASFDQVRERLHEAGLRTVAPRQRGYSAGARPEGVDAYTMKQLAEDAAGVLDALEIPYAHLVGHGLGATVAWHFAAAYPLRAMSLTAVSFGHPSAFGEAMASDPDQRQRSRYLELFLTAGEAEKQLLDNGARTLLATAPGGGIEAVANDATLTAGLNWYRANMVPGGEGLDCPLIEVPTTLVWGARDAIAGQAQARGTARYLRADYRLSEVPDGDHWLPLRNPSALASEIALRTLRN